MCNFPFSPDPFACVLSCVYARSAPYYDIHAEEETEEAGGTSGQPAYPLMFLVPAGATVISLSSSSDGGSDLGLPIAVGVKVDNPPRGTLYTSRRTDYFSEGHEVVRMPGGLRNGGAIIERLRFSTYVKIFQMPSELPADRRHRVVSEANFFEDAVVWPDGLPALPESQAAEFGSEFDDFHLMYDTKLSVQETRVFY